MIHRLVERNSGLDVWLESLKCDYEIDRKVDEEFDLIKKYNLLEVIIYNNDIELFRNSIELYSKLGYKTIFIEKFTCENHEKIKELYEKIKTEADVKIYIYCKRNITINGKERYKEKMEELRSVDIEKTVNFLSNFLKIYPTTLQRHFPINYYDADRIVKECIEQKILKPSNFDYEIVDIDKFTKYIVEEIPHCIE